MDAYKKFKLSLVLIIIVIFTGTIGYYYIEKWNIIDSLYMTVITISSVGFQEIRTLDTIGKIYTIFLILIGIGVITFSIANLMAFIVEGEFKEILRRRKMEKNLKAIKEHYIICGAGEVGIYSVEELIKAKKEVVVIDLDIDKLTNVESKYPDAITFQGNATDEITLLDAGIMRANGIIATLSTDADNLFLVVTAKGLNPELKIVSRAIDERAVSKLKQAGAFNVVSPNFIGGLRLASIMIRPAVVNFLDTMIQSTGDTILRLEEVTIPKDSESVGKKLAELQIPSKTGLIVIAIKNRMTGKYIYNPKSDSIIQPDDSLIAMGDIDQVQKLRDIVNG